MECSGKHFSIPSCISLFEICKEDSFIYVKKKIIDAYLFQEFRLLPRPLKQAQKILIRLINHVISGIDPVSMYATKLSIPLR